jgi:hypothetical protein
MNRRDPNRVERLPADLDRFLGNFFARGGWRSAITYDPHASRLCLEVRLADARLSADDRFFSLLEYYIRAQRMVLRGTSGVQLQCRIYAADGSDLTARLQSRAARYLDDNRHGAQMRRRLMVLSLRRRLFSRVIPTIVLWVAAIAFTVAVIGLPFATTVTVTLVALLLQVALVRYHALRR